jgi:ABC-type multidrug transport system fused ATPase/permease subunit
MSAVVLMARWLRSLDKLSVFLIISSAGTLWTVALGRIMYRNPLTQNQTSVWSFWTYGFMNSWMKRFPLDGLRMRRSDLPPEKLADGEQSVVAKDRARFMAAWHARGRSSSAALATLMMPWWVYTHAMQVPRKFVQFLPPLMVGSLLEFLEDPTQPSSVGWKLMGLAAMRMICDKLAQAHYLFSGCNAGAVPATRGAKSSVLAKVQSLSPRGRVMVSGAEIQTLMQKMETFNHACCIPGQSRIALDLASLRIGYYYLYKLFGVPAVAVSIMANVGITALTARVSAQKTKAEQKRRALLKKQEDQLNQLASNLPIWRLYGWGDLFIRKLNELTHQLQRQGNWVNVWEQLANVLPSTIGPVAVLASVGIHVALGGPLRLADLLTAGSYINIISRSMEWYQLARQQWKDMAAECINLDSLLALPDGEPMERSEDGAIDVVDASFGWPIRPLTRLKVVSTTPCTFSPLDDGGDTGGSSAGQAAATILQAGTMVEQIDRQQGQQKEAQGSTATIKVRRNDGIAGLIPAGAVKALPELPPSEWSAPPATIEGINLRIMPGELVLISGPIASGKSTLMQSLVGNTERLTGSAKVPSIAFQPQSPILFDQTIRANILFGIPEDQLDEALFAECLEASTLDLDMADSESTLHKKGELTQCGQGGSELSGGQQARVALARCIYAALSGSECVLLDDPIKALDPSTAARVWEKAIKKSLAGKTRVLVCNSQMLEKFASDKAVDRLVIIQSDESDSVGRVVYNGPPAEMPQSLQEQLGDGYQMQQQEERERASSDLPVFGEPNLPETAAPAATTESAAETQAEQPIPAQQLQKEQPQDSKPADPPAVPEQQQPQQPQQPHRESVPRAVLDYCVRNGFWIAGSIVCTVLAQSGQLVLFQWNDIFAKDTFRLGFKKNYAIAIVLMLASQGSKLLKGVTQGYGGEAASKSIRLDLQGKLSVLGMPYLWSPEHSTAQLADLVTKDPQQFQQFAVLPLMLSQAGFSLAAVLFADPRLAPCAVIILIAYKYTKKPFGWAIQQVMGSLIQTANVQMRKTAGEIFDAAPTIGAMGRSAEFEVITNNEFYLTSLNITMALGGLGKANVHGLIVDTLWATCAMMVVVAMRGGSATPAVAIAMFNQLEDLNDMVGWMWSTVDSVADKMPEYSRIKEFLLVKECVGKSCIEESDNGKDAAPHRPAPKGWPASGAIKMENVSGIHLISSAVCLVQSMAY